MAARKSSLRSVCGIAPYAKSASRHKRANMTKFVVGESYVMIWGTKRGHNMRKEHSGTAETYL
jgi:hypothetical protein